MEGVPGNFRLGRSGVVSTAVVAPCVTLKSSKLVTNELRSGEGSSVSSNFSVDTSPDLEASGMGLSTSPSPSSMLALGGGGGRGDSKLNVGSVCAYNAACSGIFLLTGKARGGNVHSTTHTPVQCGVVAAR